MDAKERVVKVLPQVSDKVQDLLPDVEEDLLSEMRGKEYKCRGGGVERSGWMGSIEVKEIWIECLLFVDEITVVGMKGEMEESVRRVKKVIDQWEKRNNEGKEDVL